MKSSGLLIVVCLASVAMACQSSPPAANPNTAAPANATANGSAEPKLSEAKPPTFSENSQADTALPVKFPFADFPAVGTTAKVGDYVLAPSYNWIKDAAEKGTENVSFIWYVQKMATPDQENSELQFLSERRKVPNAYIVAIPPQQTAKKGDVVLTWWQTGSGMQRAIVVDDSDPARPVVRYLDIAYDNPARSRDGSTTIGKMDERLVPDSFVKLKAWDSGTTVAAQDGANQKVAKVIRVAGNSVLTLDSAGKLKVFPKQNCRPAPVTATVSAGERIKAPRYGQTFASATVSSVDPRNGRVFVRFDGDNKDEAIAFGNILK